MNWNPKQLHDEFLAAAKAGNIELTSNAIEIEIQPMPHTQPSLPKNTRAVYVFSTKTQVLKVGKVNPKSGARYTSQHYDPNRSNSNLAKSILNDQNIGLKHELNEDNVSNWIMENTDKVNFLFNADAVNPWIFNLFEVFVQCKLKPIYEGPASQR